MPDPEYPSQTSAREILRAEIAKLTKSKRSIFSIGKKEREPLAIYIDGGFGIGKTHLLASAYHAASTEKKAYLSFQELMFIVGLIGLAEMVRRFTEYELLIIDEFELDDPANIRIATNLLDKLLAAGVSILTSSNTPPGALGADCFNAEAFSRELGTIGKRFKTISIEGKDYRYTHQVVSTEHSTWYDMQETSEFEERWRTYNGPDHDIIYLDGKEYFEFLGSVHPIKMRMMIKDVSALIVKRLEQITLHHDAIRFVYCIDKLYDDDTALIVSSAVEPAEIFHQSLYKGGDVKKYRRALSRITEMTNITEKV